MSGAQELASTLRDLARRMGWGVDWAWIRTQLEALAARVEASGSSDAERLRGLLREIDQLMEEGCGKGEDVVAGLIAWRTRRDAWREKVRKELAP